MALATSQFSRNSNRMEPRENVRNAFEVTLNIIQKLSSFNALILINWITCCQLTNYRFKTKHFFVFHSLHMYLGLNINVCKIYCVCVYFEWRKMKLYIKWHHSLNNFKLYTGKYSLMFYFHPRWENLGLGDLSLY